MKILATILGVVALLGGSIGASTASHAEAGHGLPAVEILGAGSELAGEGLEGFLEGPDVDGVEEIPNPLAQ